nr:hypothetical protein [Ardenticatena sp.]
MVPQKKTARRWLVLFVLAAFLAACGDGPAPIPTPRPLQTRPPTPTPIVAQESPAPAAPTPAPSPTPSPTPVEPLETTSPMPSPTVERTPTPTVTVQHSASSAQPAPTVTPSPSPTREALTGTLLFQVAPGGALYTIGADGQGLRQVGVGMDPVWSPDGSRFAYVDWRKPWPGLYVANADGSNPMRLFEDDLVRHPAWSPDGSRIALTWQNGGRLSEEEQCFSVFGTSFCTTLPADPYWQLGVVDLADGAFQGVPSDPHSFSPSWTPDGTALVYRGDNPDPDVPGGALRRLTLNDGSQETVLGDHYARDPRVCANGMIAFTYWQHDHWEIYTVAPDGSNLRRLTTHSPLALDPPPNNAAPAWSPDCRHIAFLSDRDGLWRIYVMDADGGNQRPMFGSALDGLGLTYTGYDDHVLSWAP